MKKMLTILILCTVGVIAVVPAFASVPSGAYYDGTGIRYRSSSGRDVVGCIYGVGADRTGGLLAPGFWRFGEDGYAILDNGLRLDPDGELRFYASGVAQYAGLVADGEGYLYYINSARKAVRGQKYAISDGRTGGLIPAGEYSFDEQGRLYLEIPSRPWDSVLDQRIYIQIGGEDDGSN